jgi:membrane-associated phospholipid phosphatase
VKNVPGMGPLADVPPAARYPRLLRPPLLAALVVSTATWIALLFVRPDELDLQILQAVYVGDIPPVSRAVKMVGHLAAPEAVATLALFAGALLAMFGHYWRAPMPILGMLAAHGLAAVQRDLIGRPRPTGFEGLPELTASSLPPTRVVDALTVYLLVALLLTRGGRRNRMIVVAAVVIGASNGVVRVMLGHHWPSDALAGWSFGTAMAIACYWVAILLPRRRRRHWRGTVQESRRRAVQCDHRYKSSGASGNTRI